MKVLVVGGGGREHALTWALSRSPIVTSLLCAPGNPGMAQLAERHSVAMDDTEGLVELATDESVDLVVVGPEAPLVAGLADSIRSAGLAVFGPGALGARLEGSKSYAKFLMEKEGIPTARAEEFTNADAALRYVESLSHPVVVKADGLAAGKGVTVCDDREQARRALDEALIEGKFGPAGAKVLVEERLEGEELSVLAFTDGKDVLPMKAAQDFKRLFDGDRGPNTGGMGSYSPVPACTAQVFDRVVAEILIPISKALAGEGVLYVGVLYAGVMLTGTGPKVVEFNCRFGDPEAQALVPRLESDLAEVMVACVEGRLDQVKLAWRDEACVSVVAAAQGYPASPLTGFPIEGIQEAEQISGLPVFHAGVSRGADGALVSSGGRVLSVQALGPTVSEARARAYEAMNSIAYEGKMCRMDIAAKVAG